jgi:hypothetical protein
MESGTKAIEWDGRTVGPWCDALEDATAVVNLTGKSVNCRYTQKNRLEILRSRVDSVRVLGEAISRLARPPGVLVQASSLAIYGDAGDTVCTEQSPPGDDFGAQVCVEWEATLNSLKLPATRIVALRIAFALGEGGGALGALAGLTKCCLGGAAGTGSQYISWIHVDDLSKMFLWSIERAELAGVFNATSSFPVTNREFMAELRRALGRPWSPPVPSWAVKLGSFLMRTESSLILKGRRCRAERFLQSGFEFRFPKLDQALRSLFRK